MKKVKIMLLSLALFAVVGGALAFKARFQEKFCTATPGSGNNCNKVCPNLVISTTTNEVGPIYCTTFATTSTKINGVIVPEFSTCTTLREADSKVITVQCLQTTTLIGD